MLPELQSNIQLVLKNGNNIITNGISNGRAGISLMLYFIYRQTGKTKYLIELKRTLNDMINEFGSEGTLLTHCVASYSKGMVGTVAVLRFFERFRDLSIHIDPNFIAEIDELIFAEGIGLIENSSLTFFHGAAGVMSYYLQNCERIDQKNALLFTSTFKAYAENDDFLTRFNRSDKKINHSAPYGLTGFLLVLIASIKSKKELSRFKMPFQNGIELLVDTVLTPFLVKANEKYLSISDYSWSKGFLTILLLMHKYISLFKNTKLEILAKEIERTFADQLSLQIPKGLRDVTFATGLAGIACVYDSLYQVTGEYKFMKQKEYCSSKLSEYRINQPDSPFEIGSLVSGIPGWILNQVSPEIDKSFEWKSLFSL